MATAPTNYPCWLVGGCGVFWLKLFLVYCVFVALLCWLLRRARLFRDRRDADGPPARTDF